MNVCYCKIDRTENIDTTTSVSSNVCVGCPIQSNGVFYLILFTRKSITVLLFSHSCSRYVRRKASCSSLLSSDNA